jgi:hypothetical protein
MSLPLVIYIFFGVLGFLYELSQGSGWKLSLFIGIFYPVTMVFGAVGWVMIGIHSLFKWSLNKWKSLIAHS